MRELFELIETSWAILVPIFFLSVASVAVIVERGIYFYRIRSAPESVLTGALALIGKYPAEKITNEFPEHDSSPARELLQFGLTTRIRSAPQAYRLRLESLRNRYMDRMERHLPILNGIGNIATLLGLFGTVWGMITVFTAMNKTGSTDPYVLAGGISQALVTTWAGLAVAIPSMTANHLFESLVDRHAEQMEDVVTECLITIGESLGRTRVPAKPAT
jgi:biopolymer transport protein ExbB